MSMTRREAAIKSCEDRIRHLESVPPHYYGKRQRGRAIELEKVKIKALRPVSREQVEKVWTGCDICGGDKKIKSDNFCGAATMRIVGDSIDLRGDEKKIKFFGHIYAPSFSVKFCPFCGKPLTDEAVDIRLKELEALKDDQT